MLTKNSYAASYDPSVKYRTIFTEHFAVNYPEDLEEVAQKTANICEEVHSILSPKFQWNPWGRTQVLLSDASDIANGMASVLPYNWMYIRVAAPEIDSSLSTFDEWLRLLIMHEYVHILHLDKVKGFWQFSKYIIGKTASPNGVIPGWFKEGIAIYEETIQTRSGRNRASYVDMIIRTAVLQNKFPTIDVAAGVQWEWPGGNTRYIYGGEFLQYLADTYGEDKLYKFIDFVSGSPFLFNINRPARWAFSDPQFETYKVHNRYAKRKKPGAPRSKSYYTLWKEWEAKLVEKYTAEAEQIKSEGVTPFEQVLKSRQTVTSATISPDGQKIVYSTASPYGPPKLMMADIDGKNEERIKKNVYATQISFSPDGSFIIYSKAGRYKRYKYIYDIYKYTFDTKKVQRITSGKRARDPSLSPDGKEAVVVTQDNGSTRLQILNLESKKLTPLPISMPRFAQFAKPRFSPDGETIAVAVNLPRKMWDLYIFDRNGKKIKQITNDFAVDLDPHWSPDGKSIFFSSDRSGIYNIYKYDVESGKTYKVTNVLTGVAEPVLTPDGSTLYVYYYNGEGFDTRKTHIAGETFKPAEDMKTDWLKKTYGQTEYEFFGESLDESFGEGVSTAYQSELPYSTMPGQTSSTSGGIQLYKSTKYSSFGRSLLLPRFILPSGAILDNAIVLGAMTGAADPLKWNNWIAGVDYRSDANYLGYYFRYWYNRFLPILDIGVINYAADFGNVTFNYADGTSRTTRLFEKRLRGYAGISVPYNNHAFRVSYFYEDRQNKTWLSGPEKALFNFGAFAGFNVNYGFNDSKMYEASISREGGRRVSLGFTVTNSIFGAAQKNEQYIFAGDWREYISLGRRNVIVLRAAGGMTWGDELRQGTFALGGSLGEGPLAGRGSLFYLPLRGLPVSAFSRTRATLLSAEYRLPLISVQRGLGTLPIHLNDIHVGLFADYGNAWNANQSPGKHFFGDFMLGTGLELRGDFVLGYGLPVTGRIGYGIIVVNRDRVAGLADPLLKHAAKYGVLILQLGTAF